MSLQYQSKWYRVNRKHRCRVCDRPDWCTFTAEGAVCCMRVESNKQLRNGGWLHVESSVVSYVPVRRAVEEPTVDVRRLWQRWHRSTSPAQLNELGERLGVDTDCLVAIGCAWSAHNAWAFPMRDATGSMIGIRLRNNEGEKWAVKGSKAGLFIPSDYSFMPDGACYLVEGPTDLAAAMTIGLRAIGRAACLGQERLIIDYVRRNRIERLVIVTDNDEPGLRGAEKLQSDLPILSCIWIPPTKDIREFVNIGGRYNTVLAGLKDLVWTKPIR